MVSRASKALAESSVNAHGIAGTKPNHSRTSRLSSCNVAFKARTISCTIRSQVPLDHGKLAIADRRSSFSASSSVLIKRFLQCDAVSLSCTSGVPSVLLRLNSCFTVVAAVQDSAGFDYMS